MINEQDTLRRKSLAEFLQTRRSRLSPTEVGLMANGRRRTPGLRREEVAQLAGVGVTWYTWLEQGRDISVSDQVLESIARALHLNPHETRYLFTLSGRDVIHYEAADEIECITPALGSLLMHQGIYPAFVLGRRWDYLAWNKSAEMFLGDMNALPVDERNHVWHMFTDPIMREVLEDWEGHAQRIVAEFRVSYGRYLEDSAFNRLVHRLNETSKEFRDWWPRNDVSGKKDTYKVYLHPTMGRLEFEQTTLLVSGSPDLKLVVSVALGETISILNSIVEQNSLIISNPI